MEKEARKVDSTKLSFLVGNINPGTKIYFMDTTTHVIIVEPMQEETTEVNNFLKIQ